MTHSRSLGTVRAVTVLAVLAALLLVPWIGRQQFSAHAATGVAAFGPTTILEDQRVGGEPDVKVCGPTATWSYGNCGQDNPYGSFPYGFSTTASFISRSEDQGQTFKLTPSNTADIGKPNACPGGGDTDLSVSPGATQASDYLNFADLQGLTNFSTAVSPDGGQDFQGGPMPAGPPTQSCNPITTTGTLVDRQWLGLLGDPRGAPGNGSKVFLDFDFVGALDCATGANSANSNGNEFVIQRSGDGGNTFNDYGVPNFKVVDCNDGIAGNIQVNQTSKAIYAIHTAFAGTTSGTTTTFSSNADAVFVNRSLDGGATWTRTCVFPPVTASATTPCQPTIPTQDVTTGQDFAVLAIDKAGGLYAVWSQAPVDSTGAVSGPDQIMYSYSGDNGNNWSAEQQVNSPAVTGENTNVNVFPWIAAGDPGKIDVVWYGTTNSNGNYNSGSQTGDWYPYMSQSSNANGAGATFSAPVRVADHPNHNGGICTSGIGCSTGGDRSLADFFQVDVNKAGGADVIWTDTSNNTQMSSSGNQGGLIDEARQISGPGLFSTPLTGTRTNCTALSATQPCVTDQTGDAKYEANNMIGANAPKLDITGSSLNLDSKGNIDVRMNVPALAAAGGVTPLPTTTDTGINPNDQFVDYLTTWNYHVPGHTQANFDSTGNIYYAYLEVNRATGATTAADGTTCSLNSTRSKVIVYPGQNAVTSKIGPDGTIDLSVPPADVGNPPAGAQLYSVTAHAVGQLSTAGGPTVGQACLTRDPKGNLLNDAGGQIFDVYDKSPAYTAVLTKASPTVAALRMVSASAAANGHNVTFRWQLAAHSQATGFNILMRQHHALVRVNRELIPRHTGMSYRYTARVATGNTFYVQAVQSSQTRLYGPYHLQR